MTPAIVFPDTELWATTYLRAQLAARDESYAQDVHVDTKVPTSRPARLVTIRRDGGPRLDVVRETARLGINIWAETEQAANDLARLVRALMGACAGDGPILRAGRSTGPAAVPDASQQHRRFLTVELDVRGTTL